MIATTAASTSLRPNKVLSPEKISSEEGWMGWIPVQEAADDLDRLMDKWVERNRPILVRHSELVLTIRSWRKQVQQFIPAQPIHSILFLQDRDQIEIHPIKHKVTGWGLEPLPTGWKKLWNQLYTEPIPRIIEMTEKCFSLLEIRNQKPRKVIELPVNTGSRHHTLRYFIGSLIRLYKKEPGPIMAAGPGNGIMELDCWMLSGFVHVQSFWQIDKKTDWEHWWQIMHAQGFADLWNEKWLEMERHQSIEKGIWTDQTDQIRELVLKGRVSTIVKHKTDYGLNITNEIIKQILMNDINIFCINESWKSGAVKQTSGGP